MAETVAHSRCSKPDCKVTKTGVCAEGHVPLAACPYFGQAPVGKVEIDRDDQADEAVPIIEEDEVILPAGEALSPAEVDEFLRWRPANLVAIAGDRDSGKSTLICAIYDRFLKGPFAGYSFAGSRTLVGLEKRSHYARVESGQARPDTPRTAISEGLRFFHFALVSAGYADPRSDLMLSDRAGEVYRQARSNSAVVPQLIEVAKADRLVLLLDGGRVADPVERAGAIQSVRQTLRAFLDGGCLGVSSIVQIVTTKIDLLTDHPEKTLIDTQLTNFRKQLEADFATRLAQLSFSEIAARDPLGHFAPAHAVDMLLREWLAPRPAATGRTKLKTPLRSEFDRLLLRTPMEVIP